MNKKETGKEITLHVEGMTCTVCNASVNTALKKLDGVIDAKADYKSKSVQVQYNEKKVTPDDMLKAIKGVGFKPSLPASSK